MTNKQEHTPLMQQYHEIKKEYPDTLLFFQVGDFYELFFEDAKQAASFLGIALTARGKNKGEPIPLCGVPIHAIDHYLSKLVKGGFKIALCDQLEEPKPGTLVKRGVRQVLTPGTLTDAKLLDDRSASYLFSFYPTDTHCGLVFVELLTAQIFITTISAGVEKLLEAELARFFPDEILLPQMPKIKEFQTFFKKLGYVTTIVHENEITLENNIDVWIKKQFSESTYAQLESNKAMHQALFYFYAYMAKNHRKSLEQFTTINFYQPDDFLIMDASTQRNLELVKNLQDGKSTHTLLSVMDKAKTSMGSRMIKKWILRPLVKKEAIIQRQDVVALCSSDISLMNILEQLLGQFGDCERVVGRIALQRSSLQDYQTVSRMLILLPQLKQYLFSYKHIMLIRIIIDHLGEYQQLSALLSTALPDDPLCGHLIKEGFNSKLDQMRKMVNNSNETISQLEATEQQLTGINSLKIRYNAIQGYYIEITNTHLASVPDRYKRLQTLVGRERFITPELQQLQYAIQSAQKDITQYEKEVFDTIKQEVMKYIPALRKSVHAIAHIDALLSLGQLAYENGYVRPECNESRDIVIIKGRHPVVEQALSNTFIPNDTHLIDEQSLWIITGPNMGGKSTYLRQVALIAIMTHIGSFVPAKSANIALLDRIFTRLGASDNVADGKSTFLVEMEETALICTQATERSLVILDEVGRGTSTFDGLAIAQAVVEYIFETIKARCLFATHYHELTYLENTHPGIVAYSAASKKTATGIVFLYTMVRGVADGSFGIEVAKLAQLPTQIIKRSSVLAQSFDKSIPHSKSSFLMGTPTQENQILEIQAESSHQKYDQVKKLADILGSIDFDTLSPKKAFDILWDFEKLKHL